MAVRILWKIQVLDQACPCAQVVVPGNRAPTPGFVTTAFIEIICDQLPEGREDHRIYEQREAVYSGERDDKSDADRQLCLGASGE